MSDRVPDYPAGLPRTLPEAIRRAAAQWPAREAIVDSDTRISYADLAGHSVRIARSLIALGVGAGDRVAIWAPNIAEWILAACGIHAAGAILVPVNTRMKGTEAADMLARSGTRVLVSIGKFLGHDYPAMLAGEMRPACLEHIVVVRGAPTAGNLGWQDFLALGDAAPAASVAERLAHLAPDSVADLLFTSGTTGRPKGVMCTHGATIRAFTAWSGAVELRAGDRYLIINPFFHSFGYKAGWVAAFLRGATVYPYAVFDVDAVLALIQREHINFLPGPPTLFLSMLAHPALASFDISSLTGAVTGASVVPPILIRRMREELGIDHVTTAYGLTECGGCATVCDPGDDAETVANTCGHALPGTEVRCVDANNRPVPVGTAGEVVLRGYHVMRGYFQDDAATRKAIDADGWLHTGDVGVLDARGYLRITDRLKDMFIVGGFNCYPAEIERMLSEHPAIAQVAVIGVPDVRMGEVGCACVVLRPGASLDEAGLIAWSREHMANYKVPRHVRVLPALPMGATAKVDKRALAAQVRATLG
ncbi:MAG: fatty acid--CoA ligase [Rhodanobacter sp.]|nr:MAG: fatty acid--CoA ligase [Rhodanobacter sp.]TAM07756.1 MAG: fatty acid--CoA ligase [Rhodanobacter sp.]TAM35903.1 MAG: fatty acid--CoA ligase [Rhodanobacter sp.]